MQERNHALNDAGVPRIEEAVQPFALPKEPDIDPSSDCRGDLLQRVNRDPIGIPTLDAPDHCPGNVSTGRELSLGEAATRSQCAQTEPKPDDVHAPQVEPRCFARDHRVLRSGSRGAPLGITLVAVPRR